MCGVSGVLAYAGGPPANRREIDRMTEAMRQRGPDALSVWLSSDARIGFGHNRLAIIDLSEGGAQPMVHPNLPIWVTFNGEIYNYPELRSHLEKDGTVFRSDSDTEVLLHLYATYGDRMVDHLRGMYAFAIWDQARRRLFLARDPLGIKPLYWSTDGSAFRFASQVRALVAGGKVKTASSAAGVVSFLTLGYVVEPHTMVDGIWSLPAGHSLAITEQGAGEPRAFFSVSNVLANAETEFSSLELSDAAITEKLAASLGSSIKHHLLADVPVGAFLSAGLDSTSLVDYAVAAGGNGIQTVTVGFDEYRGTSGDETGLAEIVAKQLGTAHTTHFVRGQDFAGDLDTILADMDQPTTDGVNTWIISKIVAQTGLKVALSGVGGDELFGTYPSFEQLPRLVALASRVPGAERIGRMFRSVSAAAFTKYGSPKFASLLEYGGDFGKAYFLRRGLFMPWELPGIIDADLLKEGWQAVAPFVQFNQTSDSLRGSRSKVAALELVWYMRNQLLRDADWAGMAHSLEIRTPLVDSTLLSELAPLIVSRRPPSKAHMFRGLPIKLPSELVTRPKTGFTVPVRQWLIAGSEASNVPERGLRSWARMIVAKKCPGVRLQPPR